MVAEYFRDVAEGLQAWRSRWAGATSTSRSVKHFARARSLAFLGGTVVGGFALACFFMNRSAGRRRQRSDDIRQSYAASSGGRNRDGGAEHINCGDAPLGDGYGQQREGAV
jgi:hypothetical protein